MSDRKHGDIDLAGRYRPELTKLVLGVALLVVAGCLVLVGLLTSSVAERRREVLLQDYTRAVTDLFGERARQARRFAERLASDDGLREAYAMVGASELEASPMLRRSLLRSLAEVGAMSQALIAVYDSSGQPLAYFDGAAEPPVSGYFLSGEGGAGVQGSGVVTPVKRDALRLVRPGVHGWRRVEERVCLMESAPLHVERKRAGAVAVLLCDIERDLQVLAIDPAGLQLAWWPAPTAATQVVEPSAIPLRDVGSLLPLDGAAQAGVFAVGSRLATMLSLPGETNGPQYLMLSVADDGPLFWADEFLLALILAGLLAAGAAIPLGLWRVRRRFAGPLAALHRAVLALQKADYEGVQAALKVADSEVQAPAAALAALAGQLQQSEGDARVWRSVFVHTRDAVFISNPDGLVQYANPAMCEISGFSEDQLLGRLPPFLRTALHDAAFYAGFWQQLGEARQWQGEVWDQRADGSAYPQALSVFAIVDEQGEVSHYLGSFHDLSEHKAHEAQIHYLAHFDPLTRLPNRSLLRDRLKIALAHAQREEEQLGVLFIDLDRFKLINDTLGHSVGDSLLQEVAQRLRRAVRGSDTVCRQGADEFIVLLNSLRSVQDAELVAEHIIAVLAPIANVMTHELSITPSIGISVYPQDGSDPEELIRKADVAMYHAKSLGRNNYQVYRASMNERSAESLNLEQQLRQALDHDEFVLHYQPQIDIATRRLVGVEALVRWHSADRGLVPPLKFIPLAEESGLILQLGDWVLREACRQRAEWTLAGLPSFPVAVNVSSLQFCQPEFTRRVREAMGLFGVPASELELELTESIVMQESDMIGRTMTALRGIGVGLAVDDFGTGYSSLSYLKRLPVSKLKIDAFFVRGMEAEGPDRAIVEAIVSMGRALGLVMVAEGVENLVTLQRLQGLGCQQAQGYYYCPPMPATEFAAWLADFSAVLAPD